MPHPVESNGLLSQLVGMKAQKQAQDKLNAIQTYKSILGSEDATEGMRQHAGNQLLGLVGDEFGGGAKGGGKGSAGGGKQGANPFVDFFSHIIGKAVHRPQQQQSAAAAASPSDPSFLTRDQMAEQQQARAARAAEAQAATQAKIDEARARQAAQLKREENQQTYEQELKRLTDSGMEPARAAEEANAIAAGRTVPARTPEPKPVAAPKPAPAPRPKSVAQQSRDDAFEAAAAKTGKPVADLTAAERIQAVKDAKEAERLSPLARPAAAKKTTQAAATSAPASTPTAAQVAQGASRYNPSGDLTVDTMAWDYINTGHLPFTGFSGGGRGAPNKREEAIGRAGEILQSLGMSPADLPALRGKIKANTGALARVTSMGALVQQFENTVDKNMQTARKLSELFKRTSLPFANRIIAQIQTGAGGAEANNFVAQMHALASEWAKVMQGATSAGGATVQSAADAEKIMTPYLAKGQVNELFDNVIIPDMRNRTAAIEDEKSKLVQELKAPGGAGSGQSPRPQTKADFDALAPGTVYIDPKDGKQYRKP